MMASGDAVEIKAGPRTDHVVTDVYSKSSSTQAVVQCQEGSAIYLQAVVSDGEPLTYRTPHSNFMAFRLPAQ